MSETRGRDLESTPTGTAPEGSSVPPATALAAKDRSTLPGDRARLWRVLSLLLVSCCLLLGGLLLRQKRMQVEEVRELEARVTRAAAQEAGQQALREQLMRATEREKHAQVLLELVTRPQSRAWVERSGREDVRVWMESSVQRGVLWVSSELDGSGRTFQLWGQDDAGQRWSLGLVFPGGLPLLFALERIPARLVLVATEGSRGPKVASADGGQAGAVQEAAQEAVVAEFSAVLP